MALLLRIIFAGIFVLVLPCLSLAVEILDIDYQRDPRYLPFKTSVGRLDNSVGQRPAVYDPGQILHAAHGAEEMQYVFGYNANNGDDSPAQITIYAHPGLLCLSDNPVDLTVTDFSILKADGLNSEILVGGFRHDSSFALLLRPKDRSRKSCFLATGTDRTNDGQWSGRVCFVGSGDLDNDGSVEAILSIDASRDLRPRQIMCIDVASMSVKWTLMWPSRTVREQFSTVGDSSGSCIFCSYGSGHPVTYPPYEDQYCYVAKVDRHGRIAFAKIAGRTANGIGLLASRDRRQFYLLHSLPLHDPTDTSDFGADTHMISLLDSDGNVLVSETNPNAGEFAWLADYTGDGTDEVFVLGRTGVVSMYSAGLQLLAQTVPTDLRGICYGLLPPLAGVDSTIAFNTPDGIALYDTKLRKLATFNMAGTYVYNARQAADGNLTAFMVSAANQYALVEVSPRSSLEKLATFYFDYRYIIIAVLSSSLIAVFVSNLYRRRVSAKNKELTAAHEELARTHDALKQAQAALVAHEKYRQAKDIAGGFAHEIRNALLPAEIAIEQLRDGPTDLEKRQRYISSAGEAVAKALQLTHLIFRYTKLDSQLAPESVDLRKVIDESLRLQMVRLAEDGIRVQIDGPPDAFVRFNALQLGMVVTNLLVNSIDALSGRPEPTVTITYSIEADSVRLTFADNGAGIDAQTLPRIFDTFFSTKPNRGTGLGLAIVKRAVELYDGTISVTSAPDAGTCFTLQLHRA